MGMLLPPPPATSPRRLFTSHSSSFLKNKSYLLPTLRIPAGIGLPSTSSSSSTTTPSSTSSSSTIVSMLDSIRKKINIAPLFYHNAPVVVDFEEVQHHITLEDARTIFDSIKELKLLPVGVSYSSSSCVQTLALENSVPLLSTSTTTTKRSSSSSSTSSSSSSSIQKDLSSSSSSSIPSGGSSPSSSSSSAPFNHNTNSNNIAQQQQQDNNNNGGGSVQSSSSSSMVIKSSVRSGQQIYARNGSDLIILGNVNPGAEVLADGNIHIYGTLKGRALAGVSGDTQAQIFVDRFEAELVSIGQTYYACETMPEGVTADSPTHIYYKDDQIHFQNICAQ
eukprot:TRINITY_DN11905_c0_g3_i2.p1 TRINITY_DN11905_c0_g3~~TRINITY_DN11905_c0_g3_i2.p1  ORF type:complete len:345 (-),score=111.11 TRINITY_DN11905_c0_g3_i2:24-1028(-)